MIHVLLKYTLFSGHVSSLNSLSILCAFASFRWLYSVNVPLDFQLRFLSFEITSRASNNRWGRLQFYLEADYSMIIILDFFIYPMDNKEISISFILKLILHFWPDMCICILYWAVKCQDFTAKLLKITMWMFRECVCLCFSTRFLTIFLPGKFRMTQLVVRTHKTQQRQI